MQYYIEALKRFTDFGGRSSRPAYWYFVLFNFLIMIGLMVVGAVVPDLALLYSIYSLVLLVPGIAVSVRRLHDAGYSGWLFLLAIIPVIGLVVIYFLVQPSQPGSNEYGAPDA